MAADVTPATVLKVWQVESLCLFELTWGQGQTLTAEVPLPEQLQKNYQVWQGAYQAHYRTLARAMIKTKGSGYDTVTYPKSRDWRTELVQAEAELLFTFHHWLNHANLSNLRHVLIQQSHNNGQVNAQELFVSSSSQFLAKLPWESWELTLPQPNPAQLKIIRVPATRTTPPVLETIRDRPREVRILAIFGDETGLNFQREQEVLRSLPRWVVIEHIQAQRGQNFKHTILSKLQDSQGWDFLYFAGHSRETELTGGALSIAPGESVLLSELGAALKISVQQGLQGALFNSCNGLNLAEACLDIGLSQVIVFREPIHNTVAQQFFIHLIRGLVQQREIQSALTEARAKLQSARIDYPSAYLVPSYFRHPQTRPFSFTSPHRVKFRRPNWKQAIALGTLFTLSLMPSVQGILLQSRLWTQAVYRQVTGQLGGSPSPPTLLVQIDRDSLRNNRVQTVSPILDRGYLAQIVTKIGEFKPKVLGLNYYFDRPQGEGDRKLYQTLQRISPSTKVIVPTTLEQSEDPSSWLLPLPEIVPSTSQVGDNDLLTGTLPLARLEGDTPNSADATPPPGPFGVTLAESLHPQSPKDAKDIFPVTQFSYWFGQSWLHPIIDYSIPPQQVYQAIPAWEVLTPAWTPAQIPPIMLISAGGYVDTLDTFPAPAAFQFWRSQSSTPTDYSSPSRPITGGEIHAYLIGQHLNRRSVIPIPDVWMIILIGGLITFQPLGVKKGNLIYWISGTVLYSGLSLQLYISASILLPFLFPLLTVVFYDRLRKKA